MFVQDETPASPAEDQIEANAPEVAAESPDVAAESSPQDGKKPEPSLLDVVKNAVEPAKPETEVSSTPDAEKEGEADPKAEGEAKAEPSAEEDAALPFGKHPRFKAVLSERNTLREQVASLEAPAKQYEQIERFMQHNGLDNHAVVELFRVGALIRNDPEKAYEAVAGTLLELAKLTGRSLPPDLNEDVEHGRITEERAAELSRERARVARLETQRQEDGQRHQADQTAHTLRGIQTAVSDWENRTRQADPDFKAKEKLIADRVQSLAAQEGRPADSDAAVKLIARAHREITAELTAHLPKRPSIARPQTPSPSAAAAPAPKTLREAIELAARRD